MTELELRCAWSEQRTCSSAPVFTASRPAGPGRTSERSACRRHLSWLVGYMTVPGGSVTVTKLAP